MDIKFDVAGAGRGRREEHEADAAAGRFNFSCQWQKRDRERHAERGGIIIIRSILMRDSVSPPVERRKDLVGSGIIQERMEEGRSSARRGREAPPPTERSSGLGE